MSKNVGGVIVLIGLPLIFSGYLQFQILGVLLAGVGLTAFR